MTASISVSSPDVLAELVPATKDYVFHLGEAAARKSGVPGWQCCKSEIINEPGWNKDGARVHADFLLEGGVPRVLSRGPRKGQRTFDGVPRTRVVITHAELEAEEARYEAETGKCARCSGHGDVFGSPCKRCASTGKAPVNGDGPAPVRPRRAVAASAGAD